MHADSKRNLLPAVFGEEFAIEIENQVVVEPRAAFRITPRGGDGKLAGRLRVNVQIEIERDGRSIEARPKVR